MSSPTTNVPSEPSYTVQAWETQPGEALLLLTLLERYHQVAQVLKAMRQSHRDGESLGTASGHTMPPEELESHRVAATGLFNQMFMLLANRYIAPSLFALVLHPRAARLWLDYVQPLDLAGANAVRVRENQPPQSEDDVVTAFYRHYAESGLLTIPMRAEDIAADVLNALPDSGKLH